MHTIKLLKQIFAVLQLKTLTFRIISSESGQFSSQHELIIYKEYRITMTIPGNPPPKTRTTNTQRRFPTDMTRQTYVAVPESTRVATMVPGRLPVAKPRDDGDTITTDSTHSASISTKLDPISNASYLYHSLFPTTYQVGKNLGVNTDRARKSDICLAKYAVDTANDMRTVGNCYTGVKYALWNAGVINDYGDMPQGSAKNSIPYFRSHPDRFEEVHCSAKDLKYLPAGYIVVYTKEGYDGHIAITNGFGQEMSDSTDNMAWLEDKGQGAEFVVFRLTNNWKYNEKTKKLDFKPPVVDSRPNIPARPGGTHTFIT